MQTKALTFHLETLDTPLIAGKTLLINATPASYLSYFSKHSLTIICHHAHIAEQWSTKKIDTIQDIDLITQDFDNIIYFATKFATENLSSLGIFCQKLKPQGTFIAIIPNKTGASRLKKDINKLFDDVDTSSKAKCRIFQTNSGYDKPLAKKWAALNTPKAVKGTDLVTVPGVFSAEKIDTGSQLLAELLEKESWYGSVADLGSAYGFLSHSILSIPRQKIKKICLYELDQRAIECAKLNLYSFDNEVEYHWVDVTQQVPHKRPFDMVIMNPPFHEAQDASFELGKTFIRQAAAILKPGGTLYIVANLHLPYEKEIQSQFRSHRLLKEDKGFKVFLARK